MLWRNFIETFRNGEIRLSVPGYAPASIILQPNGTAEICLSDKSTLLFEATEVQHVLDLLKQRGYLTEEDLPHPREALQWLFAAIALLGSFDLVPRPRLLLLQRMRNYQNEDLYILFRAQNQGGIRWTRGASPGQPGLVVAVRELDNPANCYNDTVEGNTINYTGQGLFGDQSLTAGNAALANSRTSGAPVFVFEKYRREYKFIGCAKVHAVTTDAERDANNLPRIVYKFGLQILPPLTTRVDGTPSTEAADMAASAKRTGTGTFRPKARLVQTLLGRELVSNELVAILELVKNGYDADAKQVFVTIKPEEDLVEIRDDGHGMPLEVVQAAWLEPATTSKVKQSRSSTRKRRVLGNKGVGRFAASRLGNRLELITLADPHVFPKAPREEEVHVTLDWSVFDDPDAYLDQVPFNWTVTSPTDVVGSGTILRIKNLASDIAWTRERTEDLRLLLSRLVSPFAQVKDFEIVLNTPYGDLNGNVSALPMLSHPHYRIAATVDLSGMCKFEYVSYKDQQSVTFCRTLDPGRLSCGPFGLELRVWNREEEELQNLVDLYESSVVKVRRELDKAAGISIYRDGFRVLPYGEPKNDWLRLDMRRVQNPTMRLSTNQVVGAIFITGDDNKLLLDQSNREGLIENGAVEDLRSAVLEIISELEQRRYQERPRRKPNSETSGSLVQVTLDDIKAKILEKLPADGELLSLIDSKRTELAEQAELVTQTVVTYRRLATLGRLVDMILHDGRNPLNVINGQSKIIKIRYDKLAEPCRDPLLGRSVELILDQKDRLSALFHKLEPLGGREKRQAQNCVVEQVILSTIDIFQEALQSSKIEVQVSNTQSVAFIDPVELQQVIMNLVDNSIYWLKTIARDSRRLRFDVESLENVIRVTVSDNGPGVSPEHQEFIFDAYYTTKPSNIRKETGSRGLGLFIAAEILRENDGLIELVSGGPLPGACFAIQLKRGQ